MNPLHRLLAFLDEILQKEQNTAKEVLAGYIVGELLGDYDGDYEKLLGNNPKVERIADLASDLEWSNGSEEELSFMWQELKTLTEELRNESNKNYETRSTSNSRSIHDSGDS